MDATEIMTMTMINCGRSLVVPPSQRTGALAAFLKVASDTIEFTVIHHRVAFITLALQVNYDLHGGETE